jgi:hypothetical protein
VSDYGPWPNPTYSSVKNECVFSLRPLHLCVDGFLEPPPAQLFRVGGYMICINCGVMLLC